MNRENGLAVAKIFSGLKQMCRLRQDLAIHREMCCFLLCSSQFNKMQPMLLHCYVWAWSDYVHSYPFNLQGCRLAISVENQTWFGNQEEGRFFMCKIQSRPRHQTRSQSLSFFEPCQNRNLVPLLPTYRYRQNLCHFFIAH